MKTVKCRFQRPLQRVANKQILFLAQLKTVDRPEKISFLVCSCMSHRLLEYVEGYENRPSWDLMKLNYILPLPEFLDEIPWYYHLKKASV